MASRREYEMLFQLNAQLGSSYSGTFKQAEGAIVSMQREIAALTKTQADISAYEKQQTAVENSKKKLEMLQQQYDNIQKEMQETGTFSSTLENRLLAKQKQIDKTTQSLQAQTDKLNHMGNALREAGIDTDGLTGETAKLGTQIDELKAKQEAAADKASSFGSTATTAFMAVGQALAAAGIAAALNKINKEFKEYIDASMEFETAMASVRRTVGGSKEEIAALGADFKGLSAEIPITTTELGKIAETAGQLGIARKDVYEFTEVMSMLATTTDLSADTAATMLAQFANITGLTDYERLGAVVADLGDATATTASKVVEMSQGMAAAASIAGFSETDILAVSAAVGSLGVESQAGSTAMSTLISTLYKSVETGNDKLTEFADVAGMSANEFAAAWRDDAVSAMNAFIQGLNDTERNGKSAIVILDDLGITNVRQTKAILGLAQAGDLLSNTIAQSNNAWEENTALQAKAGIMYDTTQNQLLMMQNQYNNLKVAIGDNYTPELQKLYAIGTKVLGGVTAFVEEHPELVQAISASIGVFGLATAGIAAYVAIVKIAIPLMHLFAASIPGLNIITGVVAGVAALAAVVAGLNAAIKKQAGEIPELTAASRQQYYMLQDLNQEYETAKEQYGETSSEALALRYEVDELTKSYEANKQTMAAFIAENDALIKAQNEIIASHSEAAASIDNEAQEALSLIFKLKELSEKTQRTTTEQEQLMAIVEALNNSLPDLALNYDSVTGSLNMSTEALEHMVKVQAEQERKAESHRVWVDLYKKEQDLTEQLAIAEENLLKRREELTAAGYNVNAPLIGWSTDLDDYIKEVDRLTKAYEENQNELIAIKVRAEEYAAAQEDAADSGQALVNSLYDITGNVRELTELYGEAYDAALESITGQYKLWDQAAAVVAISAGEINNALQSQINYWQDYNENISKLASRTSDIEGLSEMIATFADGSGDSVRAIAGMAKASDTDLAAMVSNWKKLQDEQKTVSQSLADLETDFSASLKSLQDELENTIAELDLSQEAAQSGKNLIQGFINGANDMLPAVQSAYSRLADAAVAAIDERLGIRSPSKVLELRGEYAMSGFVGGVTSMEPEIAAAMTEAAQISAEAFAFGGPRLMNYLGALNAPSETIAATSPSNVGGAVGVSNPVFNINYSITGIGSTAELESMLKSRDEDLKSIILEVMEGNKIDIERRRFI